MIRRNIWGLSGGVVLIGLGVLFLIGQFLQVNIMSYIWPLFILAGGAAFFIGMIAGGRSLGALAVPGSVITTIGLILLVQNLFGLWGTWTYAWALIISGAGIGLVIFGSLSEIPDLRRAGRIVIVVGLALFFVFGLFFELGASLLGMRSPGGAFWAVALILVGVYILFGRTLFHQVSGPVSRSTVELGGTGSAAGSMPFSADRPISSSVPNPVGMGSPNLTSEALTPGSVISGVRRVEYHALGDMTIVQADREALEIEASAGAKERIRSEVRGDTLEIRYENDWLDWLNPRFWNLSPIHYTLYVRDLQALNAAGLGNITVQSLSTGRLDLTHSGTGNVSIRQLVVESLRIHQGGLGNIDVEGRADFQEVELTGTGSYHASRLDSRTANVRLSGLGSAVVRVSEMLDAQVSGTGSIEYYGSARVNQQVSGLGRVQHLG